MGQLGHKEHGIHEVMGSIPIRSTNSDNNLANDLSGEWPLSILCLFLKAWRSRKLAVASN